MKKLCPLLSLIIFICCGCGSWGGGGGKYYPPQVSLNQMKLVKRNFSRSGIVSCQNTLMFTSNHDEFIKKRKKASKESLQILGKDFYSICKFRFLRNDYILALDSKAIIFDKKGHKIKELVLPRYPIECVAFSITLKDNDYLVAYIDQQATSHSSTLFVLDEYFNVRYQEHLLGAKAACFGNSEKYGNYFVIKSENFWFPDGLEKPKVKINGDWLYFLAGEDPHAISEKDKPFPNVISPEIGPAVIAILCQYYKLGFDLDTISAFLKNDYTLLEIKHLLKRLGFNPKAYKSKSRTITDLQSVESPIIVNISLQNKPHWVVVYKVKSSKIYFSDPVRGLMAMESREFINSWSGTILTLNPNDKNLKRVRQTGKLLPVRNGS